MAKTIALIPSGTHVKVVSGPHAGQAGTVDGHFDVAATASDVTHRVRLDTPIFVKDEKPNPFAFGPQGQLPYKVHAEPMPDLKVDYIEVPCSCLE